MLAWAAFAPVTYGSRDEVFRIPSGTWARRMAGEKLEILPSTIRLTLGIRDVLVLENRDDVPQQFGPTLDDARPEFPPAVRASRRTTSSRARRTRAAR